MRDDTKPKATATEMSDRDRQALQSRFSNKVQPDPKTGCLNWTGAVTGGHDRDSGYGYFRVGERARRAHRVAWELKNGPIPAGQVVRHKCHNRRCVNPEHLTLGTHQDNMDDMVAADRANSKLTNQEVVMILGAPFLGWNIEKIAAEFGVSPATVRAIQSERGRENAIDHELAREERLKTETD